MLFTRLKYHRQKQRAKGFYKHATRGRITDMGYGGMWMNPLTKRINRYSRADIDLLRVIQRTVFDYELPV